MGSDIKHVRDRLNDGLSEASEGLTGLVSIIDRVIDDGESNISVSELSAIRASVKYCATLVYQAWDETDHISA